MSSSHHHTRRALDKSYPVYNQFVIVVHCTDWLRVGSTRMGPRSVLQLLTEQPLNSQAAHVPWICPFLYEIPRHWIIRFDSRTDSINPIYMQDYHLCNWLMMIPVQIAVGLNWHVSKQNCMCVNYRDFITHIAQLAIHRAHSITYSYDYYYRPSTRPSWPAPRPHPWLWVPFPLALACSLSLALAWASSPPYPCAAHP